MFQNPPSSLRIALSSACSKITWLHGLLGEIGFPLLYHTPLHVQIVVNLVFHERTKYIEDDCHSIREAFDKLMITLAHIST